MDTEAVRADLIRDLYTDALCKPMPEPPFIRVALPAPTAETMRRLTFERVRSPDDRAAILAILDADPSSAVPLFADAVYTGVDFWLGGRIGVRDYARRGLEARMAHSDDADEIAAVSDAARDALRRHGLPGTITITEVLK